MQLNSIYALTFIICITLQSCLNNSNFPSININQIEVPTTLSGQPRLASDQKGQAYLSWIEYIENDTFQLQYATLSENDSWSTPRIIAKGNDWFINWADFPSIQVYGDGNLAAHWLQMRDTGTYQYDVHIAQSKDGINWSPSFIPHRDSVAAEHGFVSLSPLGSDKMLASWLDGRKTVGDEIKGDQEHGHGHSGAMTLRTATFDILGNITNEVELDDHICDCCQTDIASTSLGPVVVYRDRSHREIRDMSIVRNVQNEWTEPKPVFNDEWKINGCPVNGPSIDAMGTQVIVAWYTAAEGVSKVQVALSTDNGANFDLPIRVDKGEPLGRVDVKWYDQDLAIVTWLEVLHEECWIMAKFINANGDYSENIKVMVSDQSRRSGFPNIIKDKKGLLLTWTELKDGFSAVKTIRMI